MKRCLFLAMLAVLFATAAQAQFRWGVKAGLTTTGVDGDLEQYLNDNTVGFFAGATGEYLFNLRYGRLGVDTGLMYAQRGIKFEGNDTHRFSYLEVPLSAKYIYPVSKSVSVYGSAGPYFSFKVGGASSFDVGGSMTVSGPWDVNSFAWGLGFGGGIELFKRLQLGTVYNIGLTSLYEEVNAPFTAKERVWSFSAAFYF